MNLSKKVALVIWGTWSLFSAALAESGLGPIDDLLFGVSDLNCDSVTESFSEKLAAENNLFAQDQESSTIFVGPREISYLEGAVSTIVRGSHIIRLDCSSDGFVGVIVKTVVEQRQSSGRWNQIHVPAITKAARRMVLPDYLQSLVLGPSE